MKPIEVLDRTQDKETIKFNIGKGGKTFLNFIKIPSLPEIIYYYGILPKARLDFDETKEIVKYNKEYKK